MAATDNPIRHMSLEQMDAMFDAERTVLELRTKGMSFYKIEQVTHIHNPDAVFKRAIARDDNVQFRRAEALRLEELRLDQLQEGIWGAALGGNARAVEVALKVLERRAKLLGLDFADLISGKLVEVEQAKVELMALALADTMRTMGFPAAVQTQVRTAFFDSLRARSRPDADILGELA